MRSRSRLLSSSGIDMLSSAFLGSFDGAQLAESCASSKGNPRCSLLLSSSHCRSWQLLELLSRNQSCLEGRNGTLPARASQTNRACPGIGPPRQTGVCTRRCARNSQPSLKDTLQAASEKGTNENELRCSRNKQSHHTSRSAIDLLTYRSLASTKRSRGPRASPPGDPAPRRRPDWPRAAASAPSDRRPSARALASHYAA